MWRNVDATTVTGPQVLPEARETTAGLRAVLFIDQLDNAWFPRNGFRSTMTAYAAEPSFGSDHQYSRLQGEAMLARSYRAHTVNLKLAG